MTCDIADSTSSNKWRACAGRVLRSPRTRNIAIGIAAVLLLAVVILGVFPLGLVKGQIEHRLSARFGTDVRIGSLSREPFFSFAPTVVIRDMRAAQPDWAGKGDMIRAGTVRLRVPLLPAVFGRGIRPEAISADGVALALVRDETGRSNWGRRKSGKGLDLTDLTVRRSTFSLHDTRRHLDIAGPIEASPERGVHVTAKGRFNDAPVTLALTGDPISGRAKDAPYPFRLRILSPLIDFDARGQTIGAFDTSDMTLTIAARAPSLKYLDNIIQAGLFGTQPIDLRASVRRKGRDWYVDRLAGTVGRSHLTGAATILKRDGRSKIDATIAFADLDFDDLADDKGLARNAALKARIGDRVLPNTRINLKKVGRTDGQVRFSAARLLFKHPSVFRSLKGVIRLEGKVLRIDDLDAGLTNGRMTGRMLVDHRSGVSPRLDVDLQFRDGRLGALLNATERVDAPLGARVALSGRGDTIREALSRSDGNVGLVAGEGRVSRTAAAILAQDMGKAIGAALGDGDAPVPLHCIAVGFQARGGKLAAAPFLIETAVSRSRGEGTIDLDGETIALNIGGTARDPSGLPLIDPIRIGGTLSAPTVELSSLGKGKGGMIGAIVKSIGGALGLAEKKGPEIVARGPIDCASISRSLLQAGLPPGR